MPTDEWERGYAAGYDRAVRNYINADANEDWSPIDTVIQHAPKSPKTKTKRKASAYSKRYGAAFRKVAPKFKKKNGSWKANGFKNAQKAAHKLAKRK